MDDLQSLHCWAEGFQREIEQSAGRARPRAADCRTCHSAVLCIPGHANPEALTAFECLVEQIGPLPAGSRYISMGDPFDAVYAIKSGQVKTSRVDTDGNEEVLGLHLPGELVGLDALAGSRYRCDATLLDTGMICRISFPRVADLALVWPTLQGRLFQLFSAALQTPRYSVDHPVEMRLAAFLLDLSARWKQRGFSATEFTIALPRQDIARLLAMRKETMSRVFARFEEQGFVRTDRKHVTLLDFDALRRQAGPLAP